MHPSWPSVQNGRELIWLGSPPVACSSLRGPHDLRREPARVAWMYGGKLMPRALAARPAHARRLGGGLQTRPFSAPRNRGARSPGATAPFWMLWSKNLSRGPALGRSHTPRITPSAPALPGSTARSDVRTTGQTSQRPESYALLARFRTPESCHGETVRTPLALRAPDSQRVSTPSSLTRVVPRPVRPCGPRAVILVSRVLAT